jgi:hypothetical protein
VYWKLVYVAVNAGSVSYRVCVQEIGVRGCKFRQCVLKGSVYWKLVYVVVNVGSGSFMFCVLEIGVCGC